MTHSTLKTPGSRALQIAALFLVAVPVSFGGDPVAAGRDAQFIGHMTVTATREVPLIGSLIVTAVRSPVVLVTDLGSMTVTAPRDTVVADLGTMTVTAQRDTTVARNNESKRESQARLSLRIPELITAPFAESRGKNAKGAAISPVRHGQ